MPSTPPPAPADFSGNVARFTGFADLYDRFRPGPPEAWAKVVLSYLPPGGLRRVVDLGSGTGLASRYWASRVAEVIGLEPSADMRSRALAATTAGNVSYRAGWSHATGLPDGSAGVISCAQALHWMEPAGTFREAARVLEAGGVFTSTDYDWPPVVGSWAAEQAYEACAARVQALEQARGSRAGLQFWEKSGHLARLRASGCFRSTREIVLHHEDRGNADRLVGVLLSQGGVQQLLQDGCTEAELGIDRLRAVAARELGAAPRPWLWSARVRLGVV